MSEQQPIIPLPALLGDAPGSEAEAGHDPLAQLNEAEVIFAVELDTGQEVVVYGRRRLQEIVDSGKHDYVATARVGVNADTDDLDKLLDVVRRVKGYHDYAHRAQGGPQGALDDVPRTPQSGK